jgi:hypothetical protein
VIRSLIRIAAGDEKYPLEAPAEIRELARQALLKLFRASPDPVEAAERRFPWRADILGHLMTEDAGQRRFVLEFCEEAGWDEPMATLLLAEAALDSAVGAVPRMQGERPRDVHGFLILAALSEPAGRANMQPAAEFIRAKLQEYQERTRVDPDPTGRAWFARQFLDLHAQAVRQWKDSRPAAPTP